MLLLGARIGVIFYLVVRSRLRLRNRFRIRSSFRKRNKEGGMGRKTILEIIAPTVEEAISQGLAQLGLTADAVSVEVLDAGNKGLFGLGRPQVRVRLTVNPPPGSVSMKVQTQSVPKPQPKPERVEMKPEP